MTSDVPKKVKKPRSTHLAPRERGPVRKEKRPALKDCGRDPITGKLIPHTRDERIAKSIGFYVSTGMTENDIAVMLNMRPGQLRKLYGFELKSGLDIANVEVAQSMHKAAKNGDVVAGKFWLKARAGWKDGESATPQASPLQIHIHDN